MMQNSCILNVITLIGVFSITKSIGKGIEYEQ